MIRRFLGSVAFVLCGMAALVLAGISAVLSIQGRHSAASVGYIAAWLFYNGMRALLGLRPWRIGADQ